MYDQRGGRYQDEYADDDFAKYECNGRQCQGDDADGPIPIRLLFDVEMRRRSPCDERFSGHADSISLVDFQVFGDECAGIMVSGMNTFYKLKCGEAWDDV